ncbi:MAG: ferritin-like domain-containing protein [Vampirovibrionales bacterium]|nr:ferritin-like domain-containing protein [Vampirovibrionales bacterium]
MSSRYTFHAPAVLDCLNRILEAELAGVIRYTHYSFMVFGPNRIPIVDWLRQQASESLLHAQEVGELITHLGEHPSLSIGELLETHNHDTQTILKESLEHETRALGLYRQLLELVRDKSVMFEEFARKMICQEEMHTGEVEKMMGGPAPVK